MGTAAKMVRAKLSTTVAPETLEYLERQVEAGRAANMAEAVDVTVDRVRKLENRERLAKATAQYFNRLTPQAIAEENTLAHDVASLSRGIDFDEEL